jgi:hypothetical protein
MSDRRTDRAVLRAAAKKHREEFGYPVALCIFIDWINSDDPDADTFEQQPIRDAVCRLGEEEAERIFEEVANEELSDAP